MNEGIYDGLTRPSEGTISDEQGDLRLQAYNWQPNSYTLVLSDKGKIIFHANGDPAATYTIPAETAVNYPRFTPMVFMNEGGGGTVTISINGDTLQLAGPGTTGSRTLGPYGWATAIKIRSNPAIWMISGTGLT